MLTLNTETATLIKNELECIPERYHKPFNSTHEGYAVILEEVRELENEIFFGEKPLREQIGYINATRGIIRDQSHIDQEVKRAHQERIKKEAVQIAAMCCRLIQELT